MDLGPEREHVVGASRLGGQPDMPADESWPDLFDRPLEFLGQIRIDDLPPQVDGIELLPRHGVVAFFYDAAEQPWGFEGDQFGSRVLWFDQNESLTPRVAPDGATLFPAYSVGLRAVMTLPSWETIEVERMLGVSPQSFFSNAAERPTFVDQLNDLHRIVDADDPKATIGRWDPVHRLFGWADQIQGDLHLSDDQWTGRGHDAMEPCPHDWRLLLQIDTDDRLGWMWGDVGRLYWSIDANAAQDERLGSPPVILQCT